MSISKGKNPKDVPPHIINDKPLTQNVTRLVSNHTTTPATPKGSVLETPWKESKFAKTIQGIKASGSKLIKGRRKMMLTTWTGHPSECVGNENI